MASTKKTLLLRLAHKGLLRPRDLAKARIPRAYLTRLCEERLLEKVDRGVYRMANSSISENYSTAQVAKRLPYATVCLISALQIHQLTTEIPHAVWIMIDRNGRAPKATNTKLQVVRASGAASTHGVEVCMMDGVRVRVTTPAKTVADCFRYRRHVGMDVALEALRDYLRKRSGTVDAVVEAAQADRIYTFMRPYLEALAFEIC